MKCPQCQVGINDHATVCHVCGYVMPDDVEGIVPEIVKETAPEIRTEAAVHVPNNNTPTQECNNCQQQLPNAVAVFVLGLLSLFGCCGPGLILAIISLSLSSNPMRLNRENPGKYNGYGLVNAGRVLAIIGLVFSAVWIAYYIMIALAVGLGEMLNHIEYYVI